MSFLKHTYNYNRSFFDQRFIITIDTSKDTGDDFTLPLRSGYNYDFTVEDWGDGASSVITAFDDPDITHTYATGGVYQIIMRGTIEAWYFNNLGDKLKLISIDQWGDVGFIAVDRSFYGCANLLTASDPNLDISNVTSTLAMFYDCTSLTTLDVSSWNMSNVTTTQQMFQNCTALASLNVSSWNTSSVISMLRMFDFCTSLTTLDVSSWNTASVTSMFHTFYNCNQLPTLDVSLWNTSSVTDTNAMFFNCSSLTGLNISSWTITNLADATSMCFNVTMSTVNYTNTLINWAAQAPSIQSNVTFSGGNSKYLETAQDDRDLLTTTYTWTIIDGGIGFITDDLTINLNNNINKNGKDYNGTNSVAWTNYCLFNEFLNTGDDGFLLFEYNSVSEGTLILGYDAANTNKDYTTYDQAIYLAQSNGEVRAITNGSLGAVLTNAAIDSVFKLSRVSGNILIEYAADKINFSTLHDFGTVSGIRYINLNLNNNTTFIRELGSIGMT